MPGVFLTAVAVLLRVLSNPVANVFQKTLTTRGHHPLVINWLTYLGLSVLCLPIAFRVSWQALPADFWIFSMLGGIAGAAGNGFLVKALQKGELSVLGPINAYKSVVGIIIGIFLLGEIPSVWGIVGTALIIGGSYFVLDTAEDRFSWALLRRQDIRYRLWALLLTAIEAVFIKRVILASGISTAFLSWCWGGALFALLLLPLYRLSIAAECASMRKADFGPYIYLVLGIGVMQLTTNYVFDHMPVGYALALFQLSTVVSVLLGHRVFKETDIRRKLIGSFIMIGGSLLIILLKES